MAVIHRIIQLIFIIIQLIVWHYVWMRWFISIFGAIKSQRNTQKYMSLQLIRNVIQDFNFRCRIKIQYFDLNLWQIRSYHTNTPIWRIFVQFSFPHIKGIAADWWCVVDVWETSGLFEKIDIKTETACSTSDSGARRTITAAWRCTTSFTFAKVPTSSDKRKFKRPFYIWLDFDRLQSNCVVSILSSHWTTNRSTK